MTKEEARCVLIKEIRRFETGMRTHCLLPAAVRTLGVPQVTWDGERLRTLGEGVTFPSALALGDLLAVVELLPKLYEMAMTETFGYDVTDALKTANALKAFNASVF